jgi:hypothetical protein
MPKMSNVTPKMMMGKISNLRMMYANIVYSSPFHHPASTSRSPQPDHTKAAPTSGRSGHSPRRPLRAARAPCGPRPFLAKLILTRRNAGIEDSIL